MPQNYHTVFFQSPQDNTHTTVPQGNTTSQPNPVTSKFSGKTSEYIAKALVYMQYINQVIQSRAPYLEKYEPILNDLPKMYQLIKALKDSNPEQSDEETKDINSEEEEDTEDTMNQVPAPKLYI